MGQQCPDRSSDSLKKGALLMSNLIDWDYLPPEIDLEARYLATRAEHDRPVSVVVHWGIASRELRLKALWEDQKDNLHSLIAKDTCTCGLQIKSDRKLEITDLVISRHHRNPLTLKPEPDPLFRGMVGSRLFHMNHQHPIDQEWDQFVLDYLGADLKGKISIPVIWKIKREISNRPWFSLVNQQN